MTFEEWLAESDVDADQWRLTNSNAFDFLRSTWDKAQEVERQACAALCAARGTKADAATVTCGSEAIGQLVYARGEEARHLAAAIRARGNQ